MDLSSKQTSLYAQHLDLGAKIVEFSGWQMPISYESVIKEHEYVRSQVGIFDVSHMGEFLVKGQDALKFLQFLTINNVEKLEIGQGQYTAICNEDGGMIDDLILYRIANEEFFVCVNAANIHKDFEWFKKNGKNFSHLEIENISDLWSQIAIQGPQSFGLLKEVFSNELNERLTNLKYTEIIAIELFGEKCLLARTGYTGEKGYELYLPNKVAPDCWKALLNDSEYKAKPIGLGARDTLRLEACYLLYGNDMNEQVSPYEAGIAWATKVDKGEFCGRTSLLKQKEVGIKRQLFAFQMVDKAIPRHKMEVTNASEESIGIVCSGSTLPTLGFFGGLALLDKSKVKLGDKILIQVRGKLKEAKLVKKPFYAAKTKD